MDKFIIKKKAYFFRNIYFIFKKNKINYYETINYIKKIQDILIFFPN